MKNAKPKAKDRHACKPTRNTVKSGHGVPSLHRLCTRTQLQPRENYTQTLEQDILQQVTMPALSELVISQAFSELATRPRKQHRGFRQTYDFSFERMGVWQHNPMRGYEPRSATALAWRSLCAKELGVPPEWRRISTTAMKTIACLIKRR